MKIKLNYIIIPLIVIFVSLIGSFFTNLGMDWYEKLTLPLIAPPGGFIGMVWTVIFILSTISALIFWNKTNRSKLIVILFLINAFLNLFWSFLFFFQGLILVAIIEMIVLELTVILLAVLLWKYSKKASILLWPYALWVVFATYLAFQIYILNR